MLKLLPLALVFLLVACDEMKLELKKASTLSVPGSQANNNSNSVYVPQGLNLSASVSVLAGDRGFSGSQNGTGVLARFDVASGITTDGTNVYVADTLNHVIRKIVIATKVVTTIAGQTGMSGTGDGVRNAAFLSYPYALTYHDGALYFADASLTIRKVDLTTLNVSTIAGSVYSSGHADGVGSVARFSSVTGLAAKGSTLYLTDIGSHLVRKINLSTREVTTLAGSANLHGAQDGIGTAAKFYDPFSVVVDDENLYVSDFQNETIRKINLVTNEVSTLAGLAGAAGSADGTGSTARFYYPKGMTLYKDYLYVVDSGSCLVRKVLKTTGEVSTIAGKAGVCQSTDGVGTDAEFIGGNMITSDGLNLFLTEDMVIRKVE